MVPPGCAELDRDHAGIAHHHAAVGLDLFRGFRQVFNLDAEVVDAGAVAGRGGFGRGGVVVIGQQREIDLAVRHVARGVVARLLGLGVLEVEHLLVEVTGFLDVVDLQRQMDYSAHGYLLYVEGPLGAPQDCFQGGRRPAASAQSRQTASGNWVHASPELSHRGRFRHLSPPPPVLWRMRMRAATSETTWANDGPRLLLCKMQSFL
jgi:hypothetical protein